MSQWHVNERKGKRGAPTRNSDWLIQMALVILRCFIFRFPLRALEGFLRSIVQWMGLEGVTVPDYTTLCRRQKRLQVTILRLSRGEPVHIAIPRTALVRAIRQQIRKEWKQASGYHRRSLAENAFFRLKILFRDRLKNRSFETQCTEAYCRIVALNRMTTLGMPESVPVTA